MATPDVPSVSQQLRKVPPVVRPLLVAARRMIRAAAPFAEERACGGDAPKSKSMLWKIARYAVDDELVVGIGIFTSYASIFFYRGRELDDGRGTLLGSGKEMRFIRLHTPADAERAAVKRVVARAFALARREAP